MSCGRKSISTTTTIKPKDIQQVLNQTLNSQFDRNQRAENYLNELLQTVGAFIFDRIGVA